MPEAMIWQNGLDSTHLAVNTSWVPLFRRKKFVGLLPLSELEVRIRLVNGNSKIYLLY